jgi:hypothetical protein
MSKSRRDIAKPAALRFNAVTQGTARRTALGRQ